jgi:hypothetical protein
MSKQKTNEIVFKDSKGYLCAVRSDCNTISEAQNIAKEKLMCEHVKQTHEYNHMYYGYGTSDGETESTWWLVDNATKNGIPVYVFREN